MKGNAIKLRIVALHMSSLEYRENIIPQIYLVDESHLQGQQGDDEGPGHTRIICLGPRIATRGGLSLI